MLDAGRNEKHLILTHDNVAIRQPKQPRSFQHKDNFLRFVRMSLGHLADSHLNLSNG